MFAIKFESEYEFSTKTRTFAIESYMNDNYQQKDGRFSVAINEQLNEIIRLLDYVSCLAHPIWSSWVMVDALNCYHCPLPSGFRYQKKSGLARQHLAFKKR